MSLKTTLCYIEQAEHYLMLFRNKKDCDVNQGKYVGVGGKFLPGETSDACLLREVQEETGFVLTDFCFRGVVHFVSDTWDDEDMYLYTATDFVSPEGLPQVSVAPSVMLPLPECAEGTFEWVAKSGVDDLPTWEGDKYFLQALAAGETGIDMTLEYEGDDLVRVAL